MIDLIAIDGNYMLIFPAFLAANKHVIFNYLCHYWMTGAYTTYTSHISFTWCVCRWSVVSGMWRWLAGCPWGCCRRCNWWTTCKYDQISI